MKAQIIKTGNLFMLLFMFIIGATCERNDEYEIISLAYEKCPCSSEKSFIKLVTLEKVTLFDTTKTSFSEMEELALYGDGSTFVSYDPESNDAVCYSYKGVYESINYICNFPEAARDWEIPYNGLRISYSADAFESCDPNISIEFVYSESEIVLTSLKKYEK